MLDSAHGGWGGGCMMREVLGLEAGDGEYWIVGFYKVGIDIIFDFRVGSSV